MKNFITILMFCLPLVSMGQDSLYEEVITHYSIDGLDTVKMSKKTIVYNSKNLIVTQKMNEMIFNYQSLLTKDRLGRDYYLLEVNQGVEDSTIFLYNEKDDLVFSETYRENRPFRKRIISRYNDTLITDTYLKNSDGYYQLSNREGTISSDNNRELVWILFDNSDFTTVSQRVTYVFDDLGNTLSMATYNRFGICIDNLIYEYDNNLIKKEIEMDSDGSQTSILFEYNFEQNDSGSWILKKAFVESLTGDDRVLIAFEKRYVRAL